jgi:hypothetical protein
MREYRVFEYELVPVAMTRGAGVQEAEEQWSSIRAALNQRGRHGFRVVGITDGAEGRAIIMEREMESTEGNDRSVSQAAEDITWESSRPAD